MLEVIKAGDVGLLEAIAVLGYGSQGHAHALNLADSGVDVVGLKARVVGRTEGLRGHRSEAVRTGVVAFAPRRAAQVYRDEVEPNLAPGAALLFAHGFSVHFGRIEPPAGHDVIMVAPKGPGHILRRMFEDGHGIPSLIAVAQDASGNARDLALAWAAGIGSARVGIIETTFKDETETDLFGEQSVLCGGLTQLIQDGFETLVEAGYAPELAYHECVHEVKLIVDLIYEGGIERMHYSISDTAEYGSVAVGPRVVDTHVKDNMKKVLTAIQDGSFAKEWIAEMDKGGTVLRDARAKLAQTEIEKVGQRLRALGRREVPEAHGVS